MKPKKKSDKLKVFSSRLTQEAGFTFIELVMVIAMIGMMTSIAAQKMTGAAQRAELASEATTVDTLRVNLINNYGIDMIRGVPAKFPENPFSNLHKVPGGYKPGRSNAPSGLKKDEDIWVFVPGGGGNVTPEQAGTTLPSFKSTGTIYHQRRDGIVVQWAYDSSSGVIGKSNR